MVQRTVLKEDTTCHKCKTKILKAVSSLEGVDKIEVDTAKGTLTVTGNADPYKIIISTRKSSKYVEVVSIGPPPAPQKPDGPKKPEEKKSDQKAKIDIPYSYPECHRMTFVQFHRIDDPNPSCCIM